MEQFSPEVTSYARTQVPGKASSTLSFLLLRAISFSWLCLEPSRRQRLCILIACTTALVLAQLRSSSASTPQPLALDWLKQFGTPNGEALAAVEFDNSGNAIAVGFTHGSLGASYGGKADLFVTKHDRQGRLLWTHQYGGPESELGQDIATDGEGDIYFASTTVSLDEPQEVDALIGKLDSGGNLIWTNTFATEFRDRGRGVAVDTDGDVYLTGTTGDVPNQSFSYSDVFLNKYDGNNGSLLWSAAVTTPFDDWTNDAVADASGNVYIGGFSEGVLEHGASESDAFLSKFDCEGNLLWTRQFGTLQSEYITGIDVDLFGNVIVSGTTRGELFDGLKGPSDAFVGMFNSDGQLLWANQFGTGMNDQAFDVGTDDLGNIFVTYSTDVGPSPTPNSGNRDVFVSSFDSEGKLVQNKQLGSLLFEQGNGLAVDSMGNVVVVGDTLGDFGGPHAGGHVDVFILKLRQVPEPSHFVLLATVAGAAFCCSSRCNRG